jgi:hypothetical protein
MPTLVIDTNDISTVRAGTLIDRASVLLNDVDNTRYKREDLLEWLNDGQRAIVLMKPGSVSKVASLKLKPGARQTLPTDGWMLFDVICNMGQNGATPGQAIRIASRELLDNYNPNWYNATASSVTENYVFNPQDQRAFYVYPPSDGTNYVEINYAYNPDVVANEEHLLSIGDVHQTALLDFMLYRAKSVDAEHAADQEMAQAYYTSFIAQLGAKDRAELENNPNLALRPAHDEVRGASE